LTAVHRIDDGANPELFVAIASRLANARSTRAHEGRRMCVLVYPIVREIAPLALESVGWLDLAERLRCTSAEASRAAMIEADGTRDAADVYSHALDSARTCAEEVREVALNRQVALHDNGGVDGPLNRAQVSVVFAGEAASHAAMAAVITIGNMGDDITDAANFAAQAVAHAHAAVRDVTVKRKIIEIAVRAVEVAIAVRA